MADKVIVPHTDSGRTLYVQIRDLSGFVYNGSAFEAYNAANWTTYDIAMTEQGASTIYTMTFPSISAGQYSVIAFEQAGGAPAQGDFVVASADVTWDGSQLLDLMDVQDHGDSNWTGATAAAVATAVWASASRTLTSFGTLVSDIATAVWGAGTRTLSAFGFSVTTSPDVADIKTVTDKLDTAFEADGPVYRFTSNALEQAPDTGDATAAGQTSILAAITALNDLDAAAVSVAVQDAVVDGSVSLATAVKRVMSQACGKVVRTGSDPFVLEFYADDDTTVLLTLTHQTDGSGRTN